MTFLPTDGTSNRSRRSALLLIVAAALLAAAILPSAASAQATRTWVSGVGDDVNPCSRTAPCKTYAGAISKTAAGGQISTLDPGGFGCVTITKSMTIKGKGAGFGSITSSGAGTSCITVNAGATDRVNLYGLDVFSPAITNQGANGVRILSAAAVRIEDSEIYGFNGAGISFAPTVANTRLIVQDSSIHDNANPANTAGNGINVQPTGAGTAKVTIKDSSIDDNVNGVIANSSGTLPVSVNILRSSVSSNFSNGLLAFTGSTFRVGDSSITGNGTGLNHPSGAILSWGDNKVAGNDTDGTMTGSITPLR